MTRRFHLLHVEDDDLDVMNLQRAVRDHELIAGITVASDGAEALRCLRAGEVPTTRLVILLDIRMPRMSGLEFLAQLRDDPALAHLPVVVLTTSIDAGDIAAAYRHHVAGYLQKPSDSDRFRDEIAAFVAYWAHVELP